MQESKEEEGGGGGGGGGGREDEEGQTVKAGETARRRQPDCKKEVRW